MSISGKINIRKGLKLFVETFAQGEKEVSVSIALNTDKKCVLHWGIGNNSRVWQIPPEDFWPEGSTNFKGSALQTPFSNRNGKNRVIIKLALLETASFLNFVLYFPDEKRWDNNKGRNYKISLPQTMSSTVPAETSKPAKTTKPAESPKPVGPNPLEELQKLKGDGEVICELVDDIGHEGQVASAVIKHDVQYRIMIITNISGNLIFHWGVGIKRQGDWSLPPESLCTPDTTAYENASARTPFIFEDGLNRITLNWPESEAPLSLSFVLFQPDTDRWLKRHGGNFHMPINMPVIKTHGIFDSHELTHVFNEIVFAETQKNSWTLMHRFNLCHDLLDRIGDSTEGMALIFVWFRFSAIRQLDWQRHYNTKPRELSHAQERLTLKLAEIYKRSNHPNKRLIRDIFSTLGRGGDGGQGQRIRDEILQIMHRHKIKERTGHFMEEWHQKLHNNTTPDDIVICEAYLAFLRSDGDLDVFYDTCKKAGLTRERLRSFERPIVTDPEFVPYLKDGLIHDFEHYMKTLKAIHSANDLEIAVEASGNLIDGNIRSHLDYILHRKDNRSKAMLELVKHTTSVREHISRMINVEVDTRRFRDLVYLDLAFEEFLRLVIEGSIHGKTSPYELIGLISLVLSNLIFARPNKELTVSLAHWEKLRKNINFDRGWSLEAKSILDRILREIGDYIDYYYMLFQKKAETFGAAVGAEQWTINLFTEEFVRGRPVFVMSMLIRHLEAFMRKSANLSNWQIISPGSAVGHIEYVEDLESIQDRKFDRPTLVIVNKVNGNEEPPEGIAGIITPSSVDILSHIAVRTRNYHLFFATCYDSEVLQQIKDSKGQAVKLSVNPSGNVTIERVDKVTDVQAKQRHKIDITDVNSDFTSYAITSDTFIENLVGGKSFNLIRIKDRLDSWIHLPTSAALPFGVFERVISDDVNRDIARIFEELKERLDNQPKAVLAQMRESLLDLESPEGLQPTLYKVLEYSGLPLPQNWDDAWMCIKRVWASKWNERAYHSRKGNGIPHESIIIAILIQEVVEAEYAFVIHTVNPFTNDTNEIYAEVVLGLGETLVGNYPGRALSFTYKKDTGATELLSYPSKSVGLYGLGLIFRSDSNGEDLEKYAGAGLYDSILLTPYKGEVFLDYTNEKLLIDKHFLKEFFTRIGEIGVAVENACDGIAQDIEGAYSNGKYYVVQTRTQMTSEME